MASVSCLNYKNPTDPQNGKQHTNVSFGVALFHDNLSRNNTNASVRKQAFSAADELFFYNWTHVHRASLSSFAAE
jgi:hypothetical protein